SPSTACGGGQGGGIALEPTDGEQATAEHHRAEQVTGGKQQRPKQRRAEDQAGDPCGPPRRGESDLDHRGSGMKPGVPVAKTGGYTVTLWRTPCHCQMTLAARVFCPIASGVFANFTPAPFASVPSGRSRLRAATAVALAPRSCARGIT